MRKYSWLLVIALVALLASPAFAATTGDPLPTPNTEVAVFALDTGGAWQPTSLARSWNSGGASGHCNRECWETELVNHVSVAQWLNWSVSDTRKDWRVLKPGTYASNSISFNVQSNNAVDLEILLPNPTYVEGPGISVKDFIPKQFALTDSHDAPPATGWIDASTTPYQAQFLDTADLHNGIAMALWERIEVTTENSSSEYESTGYLKLCITNLKHWVDGATGQFADPQV